MKPNPNCEAAMLYHKYRLSVAFNVTESHVRKHKNQYATVYVMADGSQFIAGAPHNFYKAYRDEFGNMLARCSA